MAASPGIHLEEKALEFPQRWAEPRTVNVEGDLFGDEVPFPWIRRVFGAMVKAPQHRQLLLTSSSTRLLQLSPHLPWPLCVWMGVTVRRANEIYRIDQLRQTGAHLKFVSFEPLLGPLPNLNLDGIDWVIVGGDRSPGARRLNPDWVRSMRDQCVAAAVPFYFRSWGGRNGKAADRMLDGRTWDEMPEPAKAEEPEAGNIVAVESEAAKPVPVRAPAAMPNEQEARGKTGKRLVPSLGIAASLAVLVVLYALLRGL